MKMQVKAYTISQITTLIRQHLEREFFEVWVEGEVSDLKMPSSGHIYFILKDKTAQLKCVLFKGNQRFIRFSIQDGMKILARGNVTVYERRGEYQFICDFLEPLGSGALQMAFEQLKNQLETEGLFDKSRKRPIPLWPERIGIVTSSTGAAIRDILNILTRRFSAVNVLINPVKVQGEGASEEIANAIQELEAQPGIEVIIVTRGGGSLEDLWAFNEEAVARAIYNCHVPVISAVGHEIDYTISDFVADLRAPTPSAAAELVIQNREQLEEKLAGFEKRLFQIFSHKIELNRMRLLTLVRSRIFHNPCVIIREYQDSVDEQEIRLKRAYSNYIGQLKERKNYTIQILHNLHPSRSINIFKLKTSELRRRLGDTINSNILSRKQALESLMLALDTLSPLKVLQRGYSLCWKIPDEKLIRQVAQLKVGDFVRIRFHRGGAVCEVKGKENSKEKEKQYETTSR